MYILNYDNIFFKKKTKGLANPTTLSILYIARAVGSNKRNGVMQLIGGVIAFGYASPLIAYLLLLIPEEVYKGNPVVNQDTLPVCVSV